MDMHGVLLMFMMMMIMMMNPVNKVEISCVYVD